MFLNAKSDLLKKPKAMLIVIFVIVVAVVIITTTRQIEDEQEDLSIVATIYPYEMLISQIAGDKATVRSLIPTSASPHTYSPTPEDIKTLERADFVFSNGADLETYLDNALIALGEKHISAESLLPELTLDIAPPDAIEKHDHNHGDDHGHSHHGVNPHFWLDPVIMEIVASGITQHLQLIDPENSSYYLSRYNLLSAELNMLDDLIKEERKTLSDINILYFHDAFHYFNKRYDINAVGVIVSSPGREPSVKELVEIGEKIKEHKVSVIFSEPQLNRKPAQVIADEFGLKLDVLDPLGNPQDHNTIVELILQNWNTMKKNLALM
jgi:zinc transport system substrate-binding protein